MHTQKLITKSKVVKIGVLEEAGGNWQKKKDCVCFCGLVKREDAQRGAEGHKDSKEEGNQNNSLWHCLKNKACFIN